MYCTNDFLDLNEKPWSRINELAVISAIEISYYLIGNGLMGAI